MTTLRDLTERLEKATGPDEELATDIAEALGFQVRRDGGLTRWGRRHPSHAYLSDGHWCASRPIMASVAAALALCERVLPQWAVSHIGEDYTAPPKQPLGWTVELEDCSTNRDSQGMAQTLPIAILIALLHALRASNDRYR